LILFPLVFMLNTSLKTLQEIIVIPPSFWPARFHFENYAAALTSFPFPRYLLNTVILVAGRVTGTLLSCSLVAWGFSRYPGRWNSLILMVLLGTMMLPAQITAIPVFTMFLKLGFYNSYVPLILPAWLAGNAFFIFLLKQFFDAIPEDLLNAARIDGAGEWRIFFTIGLPLCRPILWTVAVFTFIGSWNDYFGPLIYLNDEHLYPISIGLTYFQQASPDAALMPQWNLLMAASMVTMIPVVVLFFFAQRSFIASVMGSALKQ
ncbi:MAG: carbohydrate ABC transporter permease, partial [Chthoniobacteraceae bacterium]